MHDQITEIGKTPKSPPHDAPRIHREARAALDFAMRDLDEEGRSRGVRECYVTFTQTVGFILRVVMFICAFSGSARFAAGYSFDPRAARALFPTQARRCNRKIQTEPAINCSRSA